MSTPIRSADHGRRRQVLRRLSVGLVVALAIVAVGCAPDTTAAGASNPVVTSQVSVDDDVFEPATVEVATGTQVTWTWVGNNAHNVTADEFSSETQTDGTFSHAFDQAGSYAYVCTLHPGMDGTVVVTDDAGGDAT